MQPHFPRLDCNCFRLVPESDPTSLLQHWLPVSQVELNSGDQLAVCTFSMALSQQLTEFKGSMQMGVARGQVLR